MKQPAVYILASAKNGTLYTGVTSNLVQRASQHKTEPTGFSARYATSHLVWYEPHETMTSAILREKQLKGGSRAAKVRLIMACNPDWRDLYDEIL